MTEINIPDDGWRMLRIGVASMKIDLLSFVFEMNTYLSKIEETIPVGVGMKMFLEDVHNAVTPANVSSFMAQCLYNRLMTEAEELQKKDPCSRLAVSPPTTGGQSGSETAAALESLLASSSGDSGIPTA